MVSEYSQKVDRCSWCLGDDLMIEYHDQEWGVPLHEDRKLFEFLVLDAFQAGLSWRTVLHKRANFEKAFDGFDAKIIAGYDELKYQVLLGDTGIIRNRLKIKAAITNASAYLTVRKEYKNFDQYIWKFVGNKPKLNAWKKISDIPSHSSDSDIMSKDLLKRGFTFVGSTICYAFMQASGMVNDHLVSCFRYKQLA